MNDAMDDLGPLPEPRARFDDIAERLAACESVDADISLAALGEMDPPEHLRSCASCRGLHDDRRALVRHLALLPAPTARLAVDRFRWRWPAAVAAGLLAAALLWTRAPAPEQRRSEPEVVAASVRLVETLIDADEIAIAEAARRILRGNLPEVRALGRYLDTAPDAARRYVAVRLLANLRGRVAEEELLAARPDAAVVAAWGEIRHPAVVEKLIACLDAPELRGAAATALARLRDPRSIPALVRRLPESAAALRSFGSAVAQYAHEHPSANLLTLGDEAVTRSVLARAGTDRELQARILRTGDRETLLLAALDPALRPAALALLGREAAEAGLAARLPSREAACALAELGTDDALARIVKAGAVADVIGHVPHERLGSVVQRWANDRRRAPELARLLPARAEYAGFFRAALSVPDAREPACAALARLRDRSAVPTLIELLPRDRRVATALCALTGRDFGTDARAWSRWWRGHRNDM